MCVDITPIVDNTISQFLQGGTLEFILYLNMTFAQELVVYTKTPSMFGKSSVHAWRYCGGSNEETSMLVH